MTSFRDKGISSIQYDFLNLPKQITQNAQVTDYLYRADGVKVKKLFNGLETYYLDGFQYKFTNAWEDETMTMINDEMKLRIIPTAEGYFDALLNLYVYNYADHLGNVRISYSDADHDGIIRGRDMRIKECYGENCVDYFKPGEIVSNNTYYPFGMLFDHQYQANNENAYKYKFLGEELQETGWYDLNARFYMPDAVIFGQHDPLSEKTLQPYAYGYNNPIRYKDPTGLSGTDWVRLKDGTNIYDSRVTNQSEAETAYGSGSEYRPVGYTYTSTTDGATYQLGDHGFYLKNGSEVGLSEDYANYAGDKYGDILKKGAAFGAGAITLGGGPENPGADVVAAGGLAIFATGALIAKLDYEMSKIEERPDGPNGYQYALTANASGEYPVYSSGSSAPTGTMHLNAGDVWKYGETTSTGRYTDTYKSSIGTGGVTEVPQVYGTQKVIKAAEKTKIYNYFFQNGHLPPGNKIFR